MGHSHSLSLGLSIYPGCRVAPWQNTLDKSKAQDGLYAALYLSLPFFCGIIYTTTTTTRITGRSSSSSVYDIYGQLTLAHFWGCKRVHRCLLIEPTTSYKESFILYQWYYVPTSHTHIIVPCLPARTTSDVTPSQLFITSNHRRASVRRQLSDSQDLRCYGFSPPRATDPWALFWG